jgi:hypothetical protein
MQLRFKNTDFQKQIEHQGYVQFPFLSEVEVENLLSEYQTGITDEKAGFHCTMFSPNGDYRRSVDQLIKEAFVKSLTDKIEGAKMLYSNFMVKESGDGSDFFIHQDWTYVNEDKVSSWAIWVPLVDLTDNNGALHVVPGSHRMKNNFRGPGVADALDGLQDVIRNELGSPLKLKAGEAVVWDHRLVHYSPANLSPKSRVAATVILVPEGEQILHCRAAGAELEVDVHEVDTDFYMNYEIDKGPVLPPIKRVNTGSITCAEREFKQLIGRGKKQAGIASKIMNLFN